MLKDNLSEIIKDAEEKASAVSENIDQMAGPEISVDKAGTSFDPDIHATDKDGNPVITAAGYFRKKSGPRKPKKGQDQDPNQQAGELNLDGLNAGLIAAELSFMAGQLFFGPDGLPTQEERQTLPGICELALADMGVDRLSPKWLYVAFMAGYSFARIGRPKVQGRLSTIWEKTKNAGNKLKGFLKRVFKGK